MIGTYAASEGLNLQRLDTLINLDLFWNPTRLEQRKDRIQRIGPSRSTVYVYTCATGARWKIACISCSRRACRRSAASSDNSRIR